MEFNLLKRKIFHDTKLDCNQYKDNYLKRRIAVRMRHYGVSTYSEYAKVLSNTYDEYSKFLDDVTVNVTHFFRDTAVFDLMEDHVFPLVIYQKIKEKRNTLRIWSAGCSSGEEAYSIGILLHDLMEDKLENFTLSIHGTDIDDRCLNTAREGRYLPRQLESVPPRLLKRYFSFDGEMYTISPEIKKMTRFVKRDLFEAGKGKHFDIIFCRNVVIYFTKEQQAKLFMDFYEALNDKGFLVLGKTETLVGPARELFALFNTRERVYQKLKSQEPEE